MFDNENSLSVLSYAMRSIQLSDKLKKEAKKRYDYVKCHREKKEKEPDSDYIRILKKSDYRPSMIEYYTKEYLKTLQINN